MNFYIVDIPFYKWELILRETTEADFKNESWFNDIRNRCYYKYIIVKVLKDECHRIKFMPALLHNDHLKGAAFIKTMSENEFYEEYFTELLKG